MHLAVAHEACADEVERKAEHAHKTDPECCWDKSAMGCGAAGVRRPSIAQARALEFAAPFSAHAHVRIIATTMLPATGDRLRAGPYLQDQLSPL